MRFTLVHTPPEHLTPKNERHDPAPEDPEEQEAQQTTRFQCEAERLEDPLLRQRVRSLLDEWFETMSKSTRRARCSDLRQFAAHILEKPAPAPSANANTDAAIVVLGLLHLGVAHTTAAIAHYFETNRGERSPQTLSRRLTTLRTWARVLHLNDAAPCTLDGVPRDAFIPPKTDSTPRPSNEHDDVATSEAKSYDVTDQERGELSPSDQNRAERFVTARNHIIAILSAHSMLRTGGAVALQNLLWRDVEFGPAESVAIHILSRAGQMMRCTLVFETSRALIQWRKIYTSRFGAPPLDHAFVIPTLSGGCLSLISINETLEHHPYNRERGYALAIMARTCAYNPLSQS